jgi:hypothetical protein
VTFKRRGIPLRRAGCCSSGLLMSVPAYARGYGNRRKAPDERGEISPTRNDAATGSTVQQLHGGCQLNGECACRRGIHAAVTVDVDQHFTGHGYAVIADGVLA